MKTMADIVSDLAAYLEAVFVETWHWLFTIFDVVGVVLFFYPQLAGGLTDNEALVRTVGGLMFFCSYLLANFSLYRKLARDISYEADIRLKVVEQGFGHSYGSRRSPFREVQVSPNGFTKDGLPDWGSLGASIRIENVGHEEGQLVWEFEEAKSRLPPLFDLDQVHIEFYTPARVAGRGSFSIDFCFDVALTTQDPLTFAQALGNLIKSKQRYQVVLRYSTSRVGGESKTRRLYIKGDFKSLHQGVLEYWDQHAFNDLADLARSASQ